MPPIYHLGGRNTSNVFSDSSGGVEVELHLACGRLGFGAWSGQTIIVKTGSDSSTANHTATGECRGSSEMTIIDGCPHSVTLDRFRKLHLISGVS